MTSPRYQQIVEHYEACLERHGDTHLGVDWPNAQDATTRLEVMLGVIREGPGHPVSMLDFGCGTSHLLDHIQSRAIPDIEYAGLDLSPRFIEVARSKHPAQRYWCGDILTDDLELPTFDYVVLNGVFTEKLELSHAEMFAFVRSVVERIWDHASGIALT